MKPKVVAVSYSSLVAINRKVYNELSKSCDLTLLIPEAALVNNKLQLADPKAADDPAATIALPLKGGNPRLHYLIGMWGQLRKAKPEYIFIENDPMSAFCVVACMYKLFFGSRVFCQTNENFSLSLNRLWSAEPLRAKALLLLKRLICFFVRPLVDVVYTINYDGKALFEKLKFKNVSWIPLGYDPAFFYESTVERKLVRNELKLDTLVIAYFGRIVPEKGLILLLEALAELQQYEWKLLIDDFSAYTTPYIDEVKKFIADTGLAGRVVFFHASHSEMMKYMNASDLTVVPSVSTVTFKEQYGRVVQEAIACGCFTIVSDSGFLPHFFDEPYFIFRENNKEAIKQKILDTMSMPEAEKKILRAKSMQYITNGFSIAAQARVIENSINEHRR